MDFSKITKKYGDREFTIGAVLPSIGSTENTKTGGWRALQPVTDTGKCINCHLCWVYCPDESRIHTKDMKYDVNLDFCKGCGICAQICPVKCIEMVKEEK